MAKNKNYSKSSPEGRKQLKAEELKLQKKATRKLRWQQFWQAFNMQRKEDKKLIPYLVACFISTVIVFALLSKLLTKSLWFGLALGVVFGILFSMILFGRRVQKNVYKKAEGNLGAAGWLLENMRGKWYSYNSIAGNSSFDIVHMTIGRPGVILVGEGSTNKVYSLLNQEKKRIARIVGTTPIYTIRIGSGEKEIPLSKLESYLRKLPKNIDNATISTIQNRLATLNKNGMPLPKGPIPSQAIRGKSMQRTANRKQK